VSPRASLRAAAALALVLSVAAPAASLQEPQQEPAAPRAEILPDLRIARIDVLPAPLVDGATATLRLMVHNRSAAVAAGNLVIEAVHDRRAAQPLPVQQQVLYLAADAVTEVEFQVPRVAMTASPYTFFATIDRDDAVREADESNNTAWRRVDVCGGPDRVEVADGFDNDCDGMTDEELGLPAAPETAISMLRALQRRALLDSAPLLYALPRLFAPAPVTRAVQLASEEGDFVGRPLPGPGRRRTAGGDEDVIAALPQEYAGSLLQLVDQNGGALRSGDPIVLRDARGETIIASAGGGRRVLVRAPYRLQEELFTVIVPGAPPGTPIVSGDAVALVTFNGRFVTAEGGGGGLLRADRTELAGWETFTLTFASEGDGR
jgi:hypothetical protein